MTTVHGVVWPYFSIDAVMVSDCTIPRNGSSSYCPTLHGVCKVAVLFVTNVGKLRPLRGTNCARPSVVRVVVGYRMNVVYACSCFVLFVSVYTVTSVLSSTSTGDFDLKILVLSVQSDGEHFQESSRLAD